MNLYRITEIQHGAVGTTVLAALTLFPVTPSGGNVSPTQLPGGATNVHATPFRIGGLAPASIEGLRVNDEIEFGLNLATTATTPEPTP